jgi:hypothetical protein
MGGGGVIEAGSGARAGQASSAGVAGPARSGGADVAATADRLTRALGAQAPAPTSTPRAG